MLDRLFACAVLAFVLCDAASHQRYFEGSRDLVETKWMDRKIPIGIEPSIVNGEPADIADFPYMLALIDLLRGGFRCGASAISNRWALSAAHCTDHETPAHHINLRGGSTNRNSGGFVFFVQGYWNHPRFGNPDNIRRLEYDIVLLQTDADSLIQGTNVAAIALPPNCPANANNCCQVCGGSSITVSGWGRTETGSSSQTLNQVGKPVLAWAECQRRWGAFSPGFFCTGIVDGRDVCSGDSGSPLVTGTGANRVQQGVVSFGTATCGDGVPSVHIRIEHESVRDWIRELSGV